MEKKRRPHGDITVPLATVAAALLKDELQRGEAWDDHSKGGAQVAIVCSAAVGVDNEVLETGGRDTGDPVQRAAPDLQVFQDGKARAEQLLSELGPTTHVSSPFDIGLSFTEEIMERLDLVMNDWTPFRSRRLPVFEELDAFRDQMAC